MNSCVIPFTLTIDIDECSQGHTHTCEQICTNVPGAYVCSCHFGYTLDANNRSCNGNHILESMKCTWSLQCICMMLDVDECMTRPVGFNCTQNHTCINTDGSYECICKPGYAGTAISCMGKLIIKRTHF